jgi:acetyl-CoA C-acetyltransferase
MAEAFIVEAVRSPVGKRNGTLASVHPADLAAHVLQALVQRSGIDPGVIEDVILGCVDPVASQAANIARTSLLAAGFPEHVPGVTIDRQCGSSQQAVSFAAQAVMAGVSDVVVAGGVQSMSMVPLAASLTLGEPLGCTDPFNSSAGFRLRYGGQEISQFKGAEWIAANWKISREDMEEFAVTSHERALTAIREGRFAREIAPLGEVVDDEGPREPNLAKIRSLPVLIEGGRLTAAVSSQMSDGAGAMLVCSSAALTRYGLQPRAVVRHMSVRGDDPIAVLSAPIEATRHALARSGLTVDDIDIFEVNEAFASVVLAWLAETGADPAKVNPNGGAIALGHPLGASGVRLMTTMLHELERTGGRLGLQTMCEGGGMANVTIIERLDH